MAMMNCPKCGFEQPEDQFCAKCGVNIHSFRPQQSIFAGLSSLLKPVLLVGIFIAFVFFLYRTVEDEIDIKTVNEIEETTQLGVLASSLNNPARPATTPIEPKAKRAIPESETTQIATTAVKEAERTLEKFNQVETTLSLSEYLAAEFFDEKTGSSLPWKPVETPSPVGVLMNEDFRVKLGTNHFEYRDQFVQYDFTMDIEEITEESVKGKITIRRVLQTQPVQPSSVTATGTFKIKEAVVIVDPLPRRLPELPNSILSTIYNSQSFLSRNSELVQIIKFANPTNSTEE